MRKLIEVSALGKGMEKCHHNDLFSHRATQYVTVNLGAYQSMSRSMLSGLEAEIGRRAGISIPTSSSSECVEASKYSGCSWFGAILNDIGDRSLETLLLAAFC